MVTPLNGLLKEYLLKNKRAFVYELSRLEEGKEVRLIPNSALSAGGYILSPSEGLADWNTARLIVSPECAIKSLALLPKTEIQLLTPTKWSNVFVKAGFKQEQTLLAFTSENLQQMPIKPLPSGYELKVKNEYGLPSELRIFFDGRIVAFLSVIHRAEGRLEAAAETQIAHRGRGLAAAMLGALVQKARRQGVIVHYNVEENNLASIRVAQKCGLRQAKELDLARFIKPCGYYKPRRLLKAWGG